MYPLLPLKFMKKEDFFFLSLKVQVFSGLNLSSSMQLILIPPNTVNQRMLYFSTSVNFFFSFWLYGNANSKLRRQYRTMNKCESGFFLNFTCRLVFPNAVQRKILFSTNELWTFFSQMIIFIYYKVHIESYNRMFE